MVFNPLPPQMSCSSSPYFCSFSAFFSLSYTSLSVSLFFVPTLTPQDFPSSPVLLPYSSLTLAHLCRSHFSSCRHFLFSHSHTQLSLHWPRVTGIVFQSTAPSLYLLGCLYPLQEISQHHYKSQIAVTVTKSSAGTSKRFIQNEKLYQDDQKKK